MTLTDAQLKSAGADLRNVADLLDPPTGSGTGTTPTNVPTQPPTTSGTGSGGSGTTSGAGGTVVGSDFTGRTKNSRFSTTVFEDNFPNLVDFGQFFNKYSKWTAYPTSYLVTDKQGFYDPANVSVQNLDDGGKQITAMVSRVLPASQSSLKNNKPSGAACRPRFNADNNGYTASERVSFRAKLLDSGSGAHLVPLGWPPHDSDWPASGELDVLEIGFSDTQITAYIHAKNGGSNGERQRVYHAPVDPHQWFVLTWERIAGKEIHWYVNGTEYQPNTPWTQAEIPDGSFRWEIPQLESKGSGPSSPLRFALDWVVIETP